MTETNERQPDASGPEVLPPAPRSYRFLLPLCLVLCGIVLLTSDVDLQSIHAWIRQAGPIAPLVFALMSVVMMSVLLPKTVISVTAGALFGTIWGSLLLLVIAVTAATLNYFVGRWWLHDSILYRLDVSSDSDDKRRIVWVRAMRELATDAGFGFHLLFRLAPIPTMIISYCMGAMGARLAPFLLAASVAVIPQMLWVHGGSVAWAADDPLGGALRWVSAIVSISVAVVLSLLVPGAAARQIARGQTENA